MATKTKKETPTPIDPALQQQKDDVEKAVLNKLGRPGRLLRVGVTKITDRAYRVNIYTTRLNVGDTIDIGLPSIAHSFFVTGHPVDIAHGRIQSDPPITRTY